MKKMTIIGLLDENVSTSIRKIMEELSRKTGSKKALTFPPHVSLRNDFMIEETKLAGLVDAMGKQLNSVKQMDVQLVKYGSYPWRIFYIEVQHTESLDKLHKDVMHTVQPYRTSWVDENLIQSKHFSGKQREYILEYGYQFAFEFYSPHVTIVSNDISQEAFEKTKAELDANQFSMQANIQSIALIDRDNNNSIYHEFKLQ